MRHGLSLGLLLLAATSGCNRGGGVRVVVLFEGFRPGCLEVTATDAVGGDADSVELDGAALSNGKAVIGLSPRSDWSRDVNLRVRSFERACGGPVLEDLARSAPLRLQAGVIGEWEVTLRAADADGDGFAGGAPEVNGTDCDDASPARHPGATEACGADDTNCDGRAGCLDPLCVEVACDDGAASTIGDVCRADGGCSGKSFTDCAPGTWVSASGTATSDPVCSACASGSFSASTNAVACTTWSDCVAGQYVTVPASSVVDRSCAVCAAGFYSAVPNSTGCAPVGTCAPGLAETSPATSTSPVQCAFCAPGTYCAGGATGRVQCASGTWDDDANATSVCVPWTECLAGFAQTAPGSMTLDRTCSLCGAGTFCAGGAAASVPCAGGTWDDDANATTACVPWAQCAPGFAVNAPGSTTANRTCSPCSAGTFSTTTAASSCDLWTTCPAGAYVSATGSATTNQGCTACPTGFTTGPNALTCTDWTVCTADTWESVAPTPTRDRTCSNYVSCLDRLTHVPSSPNGSYLIDVDGVGGGAPFSVKCEMTAAPGGGWTVISSEDFAASAAGWSDSRRDTTSGCFTAWSAMLGGYNVFGAGATSSKTYDLLGVPHTQIRVSLTYYVIDSWDSESGLVSIDGALVYNSSFSYVGAGNVCGTAFGDRGAQVIGFAPFHLANTAQLTVTSNLNEGAGNEAFGVDDVLIMVR